MLCVVAQRLNLLLDFECAHAKHGQTAVESLSPRLPVLNDPTPEAKIDFYISERLLLERHASV